MYAHAIMDMKTVRMINKYTFVAETAVDAVVVVERILRIGRRIKYRMITPGAMQITLYTFGMSKGSGGYHGFYEIMNWERACNSIYDTFGVDAIFLFELYARWGRIRLIVDGEQIGGTQLDGIEYIDADIHIKSFEGGWRIEVMYDLI